MSDLLIKNCLAVYEDGIKQTDILISGGKIKKIGQDIEAENLEIIDAKGKHAFRAFTDVHTHLREPGFEHKETIATGVRAAAKGGFSDILCMPNTNPVNDSKVVTEYIVNRSLKEDYTRVHPIGSITKGLEGKEISEMGGLKNAGAVAVSDDGMPVVSGGIMRLGLEYAKTVGLKVISHSEDKSISGDGVVNEGFNGTFAGLKGISHAAEEVGIARDIILAGAVDAPIHIAHVSTKGSVDIIRFFKSKGFKVTAETCPHYFALNDQAILLYDTAAKVNPPIRSEEDRLAVIEGIKDGTIDCIATDHAPHSYDDKFTDFNRASFGISGIETSFALSYTYLVKSGEITLQKLTSLMSYAPREIAGLKKSGLKEGDTADITLCDLNQSYIIDSKNFVSKGKNTPFNGTEVYGKVTDVIIGGSLKVRGGNLCNG